MNSGQVHQEKYNQAALGTLNIGLPYQLVAPPQNWNSHGDSDGSGFVKALWMTAAGMLMLQTISSVPTLFQIDYNMNPSLSGPLVPKRVSWKTCFTFLENGDDMGPS